MINDDEEEEEEVEEEEGYSSAEGNSAGKLSKRKGQAVIFVGFLDSGGWWLVTVLQYSGTLSIVKDTLKWAF